MQTNRVDDPPQFVQGPLRQLWREPVARLVQDPSPDTSKYSHEEKERRRIYLHLLMAIIDAYWNGNKFGTRGSYYSRDDQIDRDVAPLRYEGRDDPYFVYRYRYQAERYLGHNIAAIAVDQHGVPIDFDFNHNALFGSSVEHAEARLIRRLFSLAQSSEARPWTAPQEAARRGQGHDSRRDRQARHTNLETVTIYTSLEPCAQCAGIMALANIGEMVYLQRDPTQNLISNVLCNLARPADPDAPRATLPIPAMKFEGNVSYFRLLNDAYTRFVRVVGTERPHFYTPPDGHQSNERDHPSITSFLCTDEARDIFQHGADEFHNRHGASQQYFGEPRGRFSNEDILKQAKAFFDYVVHLGRRGTPHFG